MNVNQITDKIKEIAISLETVNSVFEGDVYENWNSTEIKYGSFNVGLQNVSNDGNLCTYTFVFYYSDRLTQDKSNANSIYSDGVNTIQSVINVLNYMQFDISEQINYTPFEQKFMDYLAGVYATVNIVTSSSLGFCNMDDYNIEEVIEIVKNGVYDVTNYTKAIVNVPQMGVEKDPIFTASPAYSITQSDINRWNNGVTPDLSSYVTKSELSAQSYITNADLPDLQPYLVTPLKPSGHNFSYFTLGKYGLGIEYDSKHSAGIISPTQLSWGTVMDNENLKYWVSAGTLRTFVFDTLNFSSYVTSSELAAQSYITANDLPDYSNTYQAKGDYVTQTDLSSAGYITSETDPVFSASVAAGITQQDIDNWNRGGSIDLSSYVTKSELSAQSYITNADLPDYSNTYQAKGDYITQTDLNNAGYITSVTFPDYSNTYQAKGDYITPTDLNNAAYITANDLPDYSNTYQAKGDYVTSSELAAQSYITNADLPDYSNTYQAKGDYVTKTDMSNASYVTQQTMSAQGYVTSTSLQNKELVTAKALSYLYTYKSSAQFAFDAYTATLHITL